MATTKVTKSISSESSPTGGVRKTSGSPGRSRTGLIPYDKGAVVLDIGHVYTRIGLSNEPAPRHIIKSQVSMKPYGEILNVWDKKYINRDELYLIFCRFLSEIYIQYLMVNPREHRVVIVESIMAPSHFRNTLAKSLFVHFSVPNVCFFPLHLACLFTLGRSTALVVDIGYKESSILPVYEGVAIIKGWQVTGSGTLALHNSLHTLLQEKATLLSLQSGESVPVTEFKDFPLRDILPDIIVKTCFVRPLSRGDEVPPDVCYPLNSNYSMNITGYIRSHAADSFFTECSDDVSVCECILDSLLQCPIDCRCEISNNIIVVGGSACLPGFNWRLKEELVKLLDDDPKYKSLKSLNFKFHVPPSSPNYTVWQGGSIFGTFEVGVLERSVSREDFKQKNSLPEWMSCNPEYWETLKYVPTRKLPTSAFSSSSPTLRRDSHKTALSPSITPLQK